MIIQYANTDIALYANKFLKRATAKTVSHKSDRIVAKYAVCLTVKGEDRKSVV